MPALKSASASPERTGRAGTALLGKWKKFFLVLLPTVAAMLLLLELLLRLTGYVPYYLEARAFVPSRDSEMLYELRPGFRGLYAGVPITINSQGFRGQEVSTGKQTPRLRIVLLGDSIAFGQGLREGESLAEQLQARLSAKLSSPVEVVNLGVPGYDTCQEYLRFKERGLPLEPQIAVLIYVDNDTIPPLFAIRGDSVVTPDIRTGLVADFMARLRKSSALYNLAWTRWNLLKHRSLSIEEYQKMLAQRFSETNAGWRKSRECLQNLIELAKAHGIRLIVIPFPETGGFKQKPYPFSAYVKTICEAAQARGAECLDVVPVLQDSGVPMNISRIERHPTAAVYARIADRLVQNLP